MRQGIILFSLLCTSITLSAQAPEEIHQQKMNVFSGWIGHWQGEGTAQEGPGESKKTTVDEHIQSRLNGTILLVEGIGKSKKQGTNEEVVVHNALAVLSYDPATSSYKFRSYIKNGKSTDAWFNITGENQYQWGFESRDIRIRFTINIDPLKKTWHETGEFSRDGNSWTTMFEMNLKKMD